jgi:serine/threonine protein kinase
MSSVKNKKEDNILFQDNYDLIKKIGSGSFGDVYLSKHKQSDVLMASKVEDFKGKHTKLQSEKRIYRILHDANVDQIPKIFEFMKTRKYHIMNMELLGKSLDKIFESYDKQFDLTTVFKLGLDMIDIMEQLHDAGIIHRDIKPNNFMMGVEDKGKLYIMDLGLSKIYMKKDRHIKYSTDRNIVGTARYISNNIHLGFEPSRRDDMESIGYLLVYFLKGKLPWQGLKKSKKTSQIEKIKEVKLCTSPSKLCKGLPPSFCKFLVHIRELGFYDRPDYDYLKKIILDDAENLGVVPKYCWVG